MVGSLILLADAQNVSAQGANGSRGYTHGGAVTLDCERDPGELRRHSGNKRHQGMDGRDLRTPITQNSQFVAGAHSTGVKGKLLFPNQASECGSGSSHLLVRSAEPDNVCLQLGGAEVAGCRSEAASKPVHFVTRIGDPARDHFGDCVSGFCQTYSERCAYASGSHDRDLRSGYTRARHGGENIRTGAQKRSPLYWFHGTIRYQESSNPLL